MNCLQKFVPPDQTPGIILLVILWNLSVLVRTCVGIPTSQPNTDQQQMDLPKTQSVEQKKVPLLFCFSRDVQKNGGGSDEMLLLFANHTRQTDRQKVN